MNNHSSSQRKATSFTGLKPASEAASRAKQSNRKKDTRHELALRKALWSLGLRYQKHASFLPGNPDLIFRRARIAVFCDGDFWHGRTWDSLKAKLANGNNSAYWLAKIARNVERDRENNAKLEQLGWHVMRFWESAINKDPLAVAESIREMLISRSGDRRDVSADDPTVPGECTEL